MQDSKPIEVSLIVPAYNCSGWIQSKLEEIRNYLHAKDFIWELIVVDDGSQDETPQKIQAFLKNIPNGIFISNSENHGKGSAVLSGLRASKGNYRIFTDCDLAYPVAEIDKIFEALHNGADLAIANRRHPDSICELKPEIFRQVYSRELSGRLLNRFIRFLGLTDISDTQAGLKGMRNWLAPHLDRMQVFGFGFDVELLLIAKFLGAKIQPVAVRYQFFEGESTLSIFRDGVIILKDLLAIKRRVIQGYYATEKPEDYRSRNSGS